MTFVRSPTFTKLVSGPIVTGSRPDRRSRCGTSGTARGASPATAALIARMCAGVVPQQPPTTFTIPATANSRSTLDVKSGVSSYPPISFGRPAFGCTVTKQPAVRESSWTYARSSFAPSAQLSPIDSGLAWAIEFQKASVTWPESVRPLASVIVPEIITGTRSPRSSKTSSIATIAAFAFSVSKIVSTRIVSAPPSSRPWVASRYDATSSSNDTLRKPASSTRGEIDAVRFVGPSTPATYRGRDGSRASKSSATARAIRAPVSLSSRASDSMP